MEEVDDLRQGFLGLVLSSHVGKGNAGLLFHIDLGVGLAHAADAAHTAHALFGHDPHDQGEHQHDGGEGQDEIDGEYQNGVHLGLILHVVVRDPGPVHPLHQSVVAFHLHGEELQLRCLLLAVGIGVAVDRLAVFVRGLRVGRAILTGVDVAVLGGDVQQPLGGIHGDVLHLAVLRHGDEVAVLDVDIGGLLPGGAHVAVGAVEDQGQRQRPGHQLARAQQIAVAVAPPVFVVFIVLVHEELLSEDGKLQSSIAQNR